MVVKPRTYDLVPGKVAVFLERYEHKGLQVQCKYLGMLLGYYLTEFGTLNRIIHLLAYANLEDRNRRRQALFTDERWLKYLEGVMPLIVRQQPELLTSARFATPSPARLAPVRSERRVMIPLERCA